MFLIYLLLNVHNIIIYLNKRIVMLRISIERVNHAKYNPRSLSLNIII